MDIWVLYDDPVDEGWNVYGLFSSEEKLVEALEVFQSKANHELFWAKFKVDELERLFENAKQPVRHFTGYSPLHFYYDGEYMVKWDINPCGLDSFIEDTTKYRKDNILQTSALWVHISATSKEEAENKANELLKELKNAPTDERGWKWVEK